MRTFLNKCGSFLSVLLSVSILGGYALIGVETVYAASLTTLSDTQSSLKVSTASNHDISFVTPTGVTTGQTILITFPSDYLINASLTFTDVDILVQGVQQTLGSSNGASQWGVTRTSGTVLTLTAPSSGTPAAAGNTIRVKIGTNATNQSTGVYQVTNPTTIGTKVITIGGGTFADSGSISQQIITDDTVVVSATVQQAITFSIASATSTAFSNQIYFGNLSAGSAKYASSTNTSGDTVETVAHTLIVSTNAPSGYAISVQGQTLTSQQNAANTIDFIGGTAAASNPGTEQFGLKLTASGGSNSSIDATFSGNYGYDATATTSAALASGSSSTNTTTYSVRYLGNIAGTTEAGTYTASLVYVATANF